MIFLETFREFTIRPVPFQFGNLAAFIIALTLSVNCMAQESQHNKPHHTEKGFRNVYRHEAHGFSDFLRWRWNRIWK